MAQIGDKVHVHYRAKLKDGREFSSTYREGKPMELADHDITLEIDLIAVEAKDAIERELHPQGCACGCDKLKEAIG